MRSGTTCPHLPFFCPSKGLDEVGHRVQLNGSSLMSQKVQYDPGPRGFVTSLCSELPCPDIMLKNHCPSLGLTDIIQLVGSRSSDFPREGQHSLSRILEMGGGHFGLSPWHLVAEGRDVGWLTRLWREQWKPVLHPDTFGVLL